MSKIKPINFKPTKLEELILEKIVVEYGITKNGSQASTSELVRFCIRTAGENLFTVEEYREILLNASRY